MNPQEAAEASAARQVAIAYLQQRGYRTAAQRLAENDNARDVKMNEMVGREGLRKAPRCGMQAFSQHAPGYEESFALLCQWLATSPAARQRELAQLRFPMFVHCFLGLVGRGETAAAHRLLQAQAGEAHSEQQRAQCEQLRALQHAGQVGESAVAQQYLGQRITLLCSAESFEAVVGFLVQRHLMLLLRLFYKFFNVHSFKADLPAAASASAADASTPAGAAAAAASPAGDAAAAAAERAAAADAMAGATAAAPAAAPPPTAARAGYRRGLRVGRRRGGASPPARRRRRRLQRRPSRRRRRRPSSSSNCGASCASPRPRRRRRAGRRRRRADRRRGDAGRHATAARRFTGGAEGTGQRRRRRQRRRQQRPAAAATDVGVLPRDRRWRRRRAGDGYASSAALSLADGRQRGLRPRRGALLPPLLSWGDPPARFGAPTPAQPPRSRASCPGPRAPCTGWRCRATASMCSAARRTARCGCGARATRRRWCGTPPTASLCGASRSRRTRRTLRLRATTAQRASLRPSGRRRCASSRGTWRTSRPRRSIRTATTCSPPRTTARCGCGTSAPARASG